MQLGRAFLAEGFLYVISLLFRLTDKIIWSVHLHMNKKDGYSLSPWRKPESLLISILFVCQSKRKLFNEFFFVGDNKKLVKTWKFGPHQNNCPSETILTQIKNIHQSLKILSKSKIILFVEKYIVDERCC